MKFHVEKKRAQLHGRIPPKWLVVDEDGTVVLKTEYETKAIFYVKLLNAQYNKTTKP